MDIQQYEDGLRELGFSTGYAVGGNPVKIIVWANDEPEPSEADIKKASAAGAIQREISVVHDARRFEYQHKADPLFFGWQRGENTQQEWLDAIEAIKQNHPMPKKGS